MKITISPEDLQKLSFWDVALASEITLEAEKHFIKQTVRKIQERRDLFIVRMYNVSSKIYIKLSKSKKWLVNKRQLGSMAEDSLGKSLFVFLEKNKLDFIPYVENHDVFHVITQIPPDVRGEVGLQCLLLGNGKKSVFLFLSIAAGLFLSPEHLTYYIICYKKGQSMNRFYDWDYEHLLQENFSTQIIPLIYIK